ncbi:MAG: gliding motility-associated C-terminal domain-containing protein, partial [Actinomycetia bacterium]|nr:gliding motility-associated C-terminal domain-containing protein [Actinomycetes bacterium]
MENILIKQELSFFNGYISGKPDTVKIEYSAFNTSDSEKSVQIRVMLDITAGKKKGDLFIPGSGLINTEALIEESNMPDYLYTIDNISGPSVMTYLLLKNEQLISPHSFVIAPKMKLSFGKTEVKIKDTRKILFNNAVALYTEKKILKKDGKSAISVGIGLLKPVIMKTEKYDIIVTAPYQSPLIPFNISTILQNRSDELGNIKYDINFKKAEHFNIPEKEQKVDQLKSKGIIETRWIINPDKAAYGNNNFSVNISADGLTEDLKVDHALNITNRIITYAEIIPEKRLFSPNGDSVNDDLKFSLSMKDDSGFATVKVLIKNSKGKIIREESWNKKISKFIWDGKDNSGKTVQSGIYEYALYIKNIQGNESLFEKSDNLIEVDTIPPAIDISSDRTNFLPPVKVEKNFITFE